MTTSGTRIATQRHTVVEQLATVLSDANPVLGVVDFNVLDQLIGYLQEVYPEDWIRHTVAVRTMCLPGVLEHFRARGLGLSTSSMVEFEIAERIRAPHEEIIHDAPVKTLSQLRDLTDAEVSLSIDNFAELTRVDELLADPSNYAGTLGLRVTPQASADDDATTWAHLGIGLRDHRTVLIETLLERPWLTQLHVSFDTPPTTLQQTVEQIAAVYQFAEDIEHAAGERRIFRLHFPAGMPINVTSDEVQPTFDNHRFVHHAMVPELFDGKYEIVSESTAALTAKAGMLLARVEYSKDLDDRMIAVVTPLSNHNPIPSGCSPTTVTVDTKTTCNITITTWPVPPDWSPNVWNSLSSKKATSSQSSMSVPRPLASPPGLPHRSMASARMAC